MERIAKSDRECRSEQQGVNLVSLYESRGIERSAGARKIGWFAEVDGTHPSHRRCPQGQRRGDRSGGRAQLRFVNGCMSSIEKWCDALATLFERRQAGAATVKSWGPRRWNVFGDRTARSLKQAARARSRRRARSRPDERRDAAAAARANKARCGDDSTETSTRGPDRSVTLSQPKGAEGF